MAFRATLRLACGLMALSGCAELAPDQKRSCGDAGCDASSVSVEDGRPDPGREDDPASEVDDEPTEVDAGTHDGDRDGVRDADDNCPSVQNAGQVDLDGDGRGDACDSDDDGDSLVDAIDACPSGWIGTDTDGDGCIDEGEDADDDDDSVIDQKDNCAFIPNPDQEDLDDDGEGDTCDEDDDGDGVLDEDDRCPLGRAVGTDTDGDGCVDEGEDDDDDGDGLDDVSDHCPLLSVVGDADIDHDGCPEAADACPTGGWVGPDTDRDGCLDIEDPVVDDPEQPGLPLIVRVDASASSEGADGESWATAFPLLQDGIAAANSRVAEAGVVEVWIAQGTYYPDEATDPAPEEIDEPSVAGFRPLSGVRLVGGFERDELAWRRTREAMERTVLSGDLDQDDDGGVVGKNSYWVVGGSGLTEDLFLDGLTVTAGDASGFPYFSGRFGGGVSSFGVVTLRQTVLANNSADGGGAVYARYLSAVDVRFEGNRAADGAAFYAEQIRAHGVHLRGHFATLIDDAPELGSGAVVVARDAAAFVNGIFAGNRAASPNNARLLEIGGSVEMLHVTVVGNTDEYGSDGASSLFPCSSTQTDAPGAGFTHLLAVGNGKWTEVAQDGACHAFVSSMIEPTPDPATGLLELSDPFNVFVEPVHAYDAPTTEGDLHLKRTDANPAIDAGPGELPLCPSGEGFAFNWQRMALPDGTPVCADGKLQVDADGNPRLQGDRLDMGAYELQR